MLRVLGDSDEKWAGSDGQGLGPQGLRFRWGRGFRSDGQGVQVRWAGGSGQFGRVGSQVRWGGEEVGKGKSSQVGGGGGGGGVPGVRRYLTPSYFSSLSPKPLDPIPSVLLHIVVCN